MHTAQIGNIEVDFTVSPAGNYSFGEEPTYPTVTIVSSKIDGIDADTFIAAIEDDIERECYLEDFNRIQETLEANIAQYI